MVEPLLLYFGFFLISFRLFWRKTRKHTDQRLRPMDKSRIQKSGICVQYWTLGDIRNCFLQLSVLQMSRLRKLLISMEYLLLPLL